jgi:hypothetical protein
VIIDGCSVQRQKLQIVRLSLSHCYRAVPLIWTVTTSAGSLTATAGHTLLDGAADLLRRTRRVTFLAGRGFRDPAWAQLCQERGWDYIIRLTPTTIATYANGQ